MIEIMMFLSDNITNISLEVSIVSLQLLDNCVSVLENKTFQFNDCCLKRVYNLQTKTYINMLIFLITLNFSKYLINANRSLPFNGIYLYIY